MQGLAAPAPPLKAERPKTHWPSIAESRGLGPRLGPPSAARHRSPPTSATGAMTGGERTAQCHAPIASQMPEDLPRTVFRYLTARGASATAKFGTCRFTAPTNFNDPLDCHWDLFWQMHNKEWVERLARNQAEVLLRRSVTNADFGDSDARNRFYEWRTLAYKAKDATAEAYGMFGIALTHKAAERAAARRQAYRQIATSFQILCCSLNPESLLMWSHYADHHKGFLIELRPECLALPPGAVRQAVKYADELPEVFTDEEWISLMLFGRDIDHSKLLRLWTLIKAEHWRYEQEFRLMFSKPSAPTLHHDIPIPAGALVSVTAGARCPPPVRDEVFRLARAFEPTVTLWQALLHPSKFQVVSRGRQL